MTDLFRFMVLRAPEQVDPATTIPIAGSSETPLTAALREAAKSATPQTVMARIAQTFIAQNKDFVGAANSLNFGDQLVKVVEELQNPTKSKAAQNSLPSLVHRLFPKLTQIVTDKRFLDDKRRIHDSIVALQLATPPQSSLAGLLVNLSRAVDVVERASADDSSLKAPGAIADAASRIVVLPPDLFPIPSPPAQPEATDSTAAEAQAQSDRVAALKDVLAAINEMIAVNATPTETSQPVSPNPALVRAGAFRKSSPISTVVAAGAIEKPTLQLLPAPVQTVLTDLKLDLTKTSLTSAADLVANVIAGLYNAPDPFHEVPLPLESADKPPGILPTPPISHGTVKPAGIADLLVVREHVLRYEAGEIAFVENVAAGETFNRVTVRKNTTENSTLTTTFSGSETERDLQVSDRFSLQVQSQAAINDTSAPGMSVSGAYGPLVDSAGSSQPAPQASSYGQDVTRRAVTKLITSTQTQVLQRTTTEFDETVQHGFDNKADANAEIVVYQWLDKIIQAKVFSYGKRVLYDFVIPEPAVFLAYARAKWQPELAALRKPTLFPLQPQDLSADPKSANYYQYWAAGYGATGIQPPPEPKITIARTYGDKGSDPQGNDGKVLYTGIPAKENIDIPVGYRAVTAAVAVDWAGGAVNMWIDVIIGTQYFAFTQTSGPSVDPVNLVHPEIGQLPVTMMVWNAGVFTVNVEIVCQPTPQSLAQWQARTHDTILQASRDRLAEYEDQLRALTADLQVKFAGKSSDQKVVLIRAELEKSCVTILSNQHFDALNTVEYSPLGTNAFPQLFLPNVEPVGRYIRFFEQAFEWDQMLYRYYPYFWGRKKYWNDRLQLDDQDAEFAAFLEAGAARVTVPVRKGYEAVVATFMTNGTIPSATDILSVTSGLYLPFFVESMGSDGGPDSAVPYGDPPLEWEVRVPTTLVKVRTNNTLPRWKQSIDAENRVTYVPVLPGDPVTP
jgi:hypothetical protein